MSARLLLLTVLFVLLAEILIYVPSIAQFRRDWLEDRLAAAQIAALALEATSSRMVSHDLANALLTSAGVDAVVLKRGELRKLILGYDMPLEISSSYDLRSAAPWTLVVDAFKTFYLDDSRLIQVTGSSRKGVGEYVQILIYPDDLKQAMADYSRGIVVLSIIISLFTAILVYISLHLILVRPIRRITRSLMTFREAPEAVGSALTPSPRQDEIGQAERALSDMQTDLRAALTQKTRLANLGTAVSKINHDLRNILASAQLLSDRLATTDNPMVQALAPRLMQAIDRAIALCSSTLVYGQAQDLTLEYQPVALRPLADDIGLALGLQPDSPVAWHNAVPPDMVLDADPAQLHRILLNLARNAVQALTGPAANAARPAAITMTASFSGKNVIIDLSDTGPGISPRAREHLFEPFSAGSTTGSSGLGLAIAKELTEAHGGKIALLESSTEGTTFRITLPR
ncbi:sensor histidine kinase [Govanella unica]|uniref:histidine kinase n=1 Tax=Govanella unica TaxID=2975056 RepID=A0A9X3TWN1_9PROT|nr:HAMP domain-containing sensor histidine kinase [Govania unica]MDA5192939.1 HAMP domain-containing histidine kinase [Govania unica]